MDPYASASSSARRCPPPRRRVRVRLGIDARSPRGHLLRPFARPSSPWHRYAQWRHAHLLVALPSHYHVSRPSQTSQHSFQYQHPHTHPHQHQHQHHPQQQQHQHQQHPHHHASNHSIGSSSGFRHDSTDSTLTPTFSNSNLHNASHGLFSDPNDPLPQPLNRSTQRHSQSTLPATSSSLASYRGSSTSSPATPDGVSSSSKRTTSFVCVANLINLSCFQLGLVVKELLGAIELLVKQSSQQRLEQQAGIGVLHSQLFILKVSYPASTTVAHRRRPRKQPSPRPRSARRTPSTATRPTAGPIHPPWTTPRQSTSSAS